MAITLASPLTDLKGIGPSRAKAFERLSIRYVRDLLFHFPRKHEDFSSVTPIKDLQVGRSMTVRGKVVSFKDKTGFYGKRRLLRIYCDIADETGVLHVVWFNLRFLKDKLRVGTEMYIAGTVEKSKFAPTRFSMRSPSLEFVTQDESQRIHTAAITPIYGETAGISSRFIRYQIKQLFLAIKLVPEYLPEDIIERNDLVGIQEAIESVHFPSSQEQLERAKTRLQFDELFFLQLAALVRKKHLEQSLAHRIPADTSAIHHYAKQLPFTLTGAQECAIEEIIQDINKTHPMNRLLQGDVGSGKTAVALISAMMTLAAGKKILYLAPTEILAHQQVASFKKYLGEDHVYLLVGSMKSREKSNTISLLMQQRAVCVIGTHALLQEGIVGSDIGLAIIDEQHRFGVAQRKALLALEEGYVPHLLSMTATPIPRTLNLTVYGDLEVSVLDELPPGRTPIVTRLLDGNTKDNAIIHMLEDLHKGYQAYVIAPVIEDSPILAVKSARRAFQEIQELFPGIAVGLLHGQMKSEEKEAAMNNFSEGAIQLLVATSVVEVGVDVPNATIMMIEGAERFGLAQLHQFRGRIGRGKRASTCYLVPSDGSEAAHERLQLFVATNDGFKIAEADLRFRGPGEVYGLAQSGFGNLRVASLLDYKMIKLARSEAARVLEKDPMLTHYPVLRKKVEQKNAIAHFE